MILSRLLCKIFSDRHMGDDLPFTLGALFTRGLIYTGRMLYHNESGWGAYALAPRETALDYDRSIDFIHDRILEGSHAALSCVMGKRGFLPEATGHPHAQVQQYAEHSTNGAHVRYGH